MFHADNPLSDEITIAGRAERCYVMEDYREGVSNVSGSSMLATIKYPAGGHVTKNASVVYRGLPYTIGSIRQQVSEGTVMLVLNKAAPGAA